MGREMQTERQRDKTRTGRGERGTTAVLFRQRKPSSLITDPGEDSLDFGISERKANLGNRWKDKSCTGGDRDARTGWASEVKGIQVFSMKEEAGSSSRTWGAGR